MKSLARLSLGAVLASVLAACGGNRIGPPTSGPIYLADGPYCALPNGQSPQLVYPVNGSTVSGQPPIVLADTSATIYSAPAPYYAEIANTNDRQYLQNQSGLILGFYGVFSQIAANQIPVPSSPTTTANPIYELSTPEFPNATQPTTQTFYVYIGNESACAPNGPIGHFTIQEPSS